jgi:hypothetical protein
MFLNITNVSFSSQVNHTKKYNHEIDFCRSHFPLGGFSENQQELTRPAALAAGGRVAEFVLRGERKR